MPAQHEVDRLRRRQFRCADEIPLVLSIFIIQNDDNLPAANSIHGRLYRTETLMRHPALPFAIPMESNDFANPDGSTFDPIVGACLHLSLAGS
jgi:hypothetical protein